jgi:hypothetical protein
LQGAFVDEEVTVERVEAVLLLVAEAVTVM